MFKTPLMLIMNNLWVTLSRLWRRGRQIYRPACCLSAGSTPSKQNPITQARLERLNTCFLFFPNFFFPVQTHSLPLSRLLFVFRCKEDEVRGMRRAPLLLYFLSTETLFTRKISSQLLILLAVDCGCTYSAMHLLNCLLLKLYKHCRRSHCLPKLNPSAYFFFFFFLHES